MVSFPFEAVCRLSNSAGAQSRPTGTRLWNERRGGMRRRAFQKLDEHGSQVDKCRRRIRKLDVNGSQIDQSAGMLSWMDEHGSQVD